MPFQSNQSLVPARQEFPKRLRQAAGNWLVCGLCLVSAVVLDPPGHACKSAWAAAPQELLESRAKALEQYYLELKKNPKISERERHDLRGRILGPEAEKDSRSAAQSMAPRDATPNPATLSADDWSTIKNEVKEYARKEPGITKFGDADAMVERVFEKKAQLLNPNMTDEELKSNETIRQVEMEIASTPDRKAKPKKSKDPDTVPVSSSAPTASGSGNQVTPDSGPKQKDRFILDGSGVPKEIAYPKKKKPSSP